MTKRQESLHDEIIRISDIFQLGLSKEDRDWFYKFIQRMNENKMWDRYIFFQLDFLSKDFIEEFNTTGRGLAAKIVYNNPLHALKLFGFGGSVNRIQSKYDTNDFLKFIIDIKDELKDEWVENNIELFDDSCNPSCRWTYYNRYPYNSNSNKYTPWYWVFESKSISQRLKEKYKNKPILIPYFDADVKQYKKQSKTIWNKMFS